MPAFIKVGTTWKTPSKIFVKVGSTWKDISKGFVKVGSVWKEFFTSAITPAPEAQSEITLSAANATTGLRSLTGKHYHWNDIDTLYYGFEKSTDNVSYTSLSSGVATNPGTGSSTTNTTSLLSNGTHVVANTTNYYRYVTTGENTTYSTQASSPSNSVTVEGPRDITSLTASTVSSTSITISWSGGTYANSFRINYAAGSSNFDSYVDVSSSPYTITGLSPSTTYYFAVRPYTGSLVSNTVTGYYGNLSNTVNATTQAAPVPTQTSGPSISGTGTWFTSVSATGGTYTNASSVTTRIRGIFAPQNPTSGFAYTSDGFSGGNFSSPKIITQSDTRTPPYIFYAQDVVTGLGGTVYYFWSSTKITANKDFAQDTYQRTVAGGLGTATPTRNASLSPDSWIYDSGLNLGIFSVNGSAAVSSESISFFEFPGNVPKQALQWSKNNINIQASLPSGGGGSGLLYWMTSAGSWWATVPRYDYQQNTYISRTWDKQQSSVTCGASATYCSLAAIGTAVGDRCSGYTSTPNDCNTCTGSVVRTTDNTLSTACGGKCSCTFVGTSAIYSCSTSLTTGTNTQCSNTVFASSPYTAADVGKRCSACNLNVPIAGRASWRVVVSTTVNNYDCTLLVCNPSYTYSKNVSSVSCTGTGGSCNTETNPLCACPTVGTNAGDFCNCQSSSYTKTTYYSRINIYSGNGSSIVSKAQQVLAQPVLNGAYDGVSFTKIYGISTSINGDIITARGFSDTGLTTQMGSTLTYTVTTSDLSSAPKSLSSGENSAGIIVGPTDANRSNQWDNLYIS